MTVDPEVRREQKRRAAKKYYWTPKGQEYTRKYRREHYKKNREQRLAYEKNRYATPAVKLRTKHNQFLRFYGITIDDYNARLAEQGGVCAICRKPETAMYRGQIKMLAVDHDHGTGAVRGLLCANCNHILGAAQDDTAILRRAIEYLSPITGG